MIARETCLWAIDESVPPIVVYADEAALLSADVFLYGNVYVKQNRAGVYVRIHPPDLAPDGHYVCGAAYCDDPACNTHGPKGRDA